VRNIFDQYTQPENRLTHALACTLHHDKTLLVPFLRWLEIDDIPSVSGLNIAEQTVPGSYVPGTEAEARGLPDMVVFDNSGWAILFESKVQSGLSTDQLVRHARTAARFGYESASVVAITVDAPKAKLPPTVRHVLWRDVYSWFNTQAAGSFFSRQFVEYLRAFERQMVERDYQIRGTVTMFDGFHFDEKNPYTYLEGKRLIRLLGDVLQQRSDLQKLGIDPSGTRRPAITGNGHDRVWDFLPLQLAQGAGSFTAFPHLTMGINSEHAVASVTIPNGIQGGFKSRLRAAGSDGFGHILLQVEKELRPIIKRSKDAVPAVYVTQRHYKSQRSKAIVDARMDVDLRTYAPGGAGGTKYQPQWVESIYHVLTQKQSNVQFGLDMRFDYQCPIIRSAGCADLFAATWLASRPLLDFVLDE
jgi:hypothetical protein